LKKERTSHRFEEKAGLPSASLMRINRRRFLSLGALAGIGTVLPLQSCLFDSKPEPIAQRDPNVLSPLEWDTLLAVQEVLFPHEKDSPGAIDVNAAGYFQWVLKDPMLDPKEIAFKKNGLTWLEEESMELYQKSFIDLKEKEQNETLLSIREHSWGRSWISTMLLHIFEALLSDPIYGANTDEKGWQWLDYTPGIPRPVAGKIYLNYTLSDGTKVSPNND
jgi:hypothetical protein